MPNWNTFNQPGIFKHLDLKLKILRMWCAKCLHKECEQDRKSERDVCIHTHCQTDLFTMTIPFMYSLIHACIAFAYRLSSWFQKPGTNEWEKNHSDNNISSKRAASVLNSALIHKNESLLLFFFKYIFIVVVVVILLISFFLSLFT